jgi:hypothetical protein
MAKKAAAAAAVAALAIVSDEIRGVAPSTEGPTLVPMGPMDKVLGAFATIRHEQYDGLEERGREESLVQAGAGGAAARMKQQLAREKRREVRADLKKGKEAGSATERAKRAKRAAEEKKRKEAEEEAMEDRRQRAAPEELLKGDRIVYQINDGWTISPDRSLAGDGGTKVVDRLCKEADGGTAAKKWAETAGMRGATVLGRECKPHESRANDVLDGAKPVLTGSAAMLAGSARMKAMADETQAAPVVPTPAKKKTKPRRLGKYVWLRIRLDDNCGNVLSEQCKILVVRLTGKGATEGRWARERSGEMEFAKVRAKQRRRTEEQAYLRVQQAAREEMDGGPTPMRQAQVRIEASAVHQWISLPNRLGKHVRQQEDYESGKGLRALRAAEERQRGAAALALANAAKKGKGKPKKKIVHLVVANDLLKKMGLDGDSRTAIEMPA